MEYSRQQHLNDQYIRILNLEELILEDHNTLARNEKRSPVQKSTTAMGRLWYC